MHRFPWFALAGTLLLAGGLVACGGPEGRDGTPGRTGPPVVAAVNYPVAFFAETIGGDAIHVVLPVPQGVDPAWWVPSPDDVKVFQEADRILLNGATYAKWVDKVSLPASKLVDTSKPGADRYIELEETVTHSHGPEGEHEHMGVAFTTWLDPALARIQARTVKEALAELAPAEAEAMASRLDGLLASLTELEERMREAVAADPDRAVLFSHPVYPYLERALGMNGRSLHWEPDEEPDEALWRAFDTLRAEHPATVLFWESEPLPEIVRALETRGVRSFVFDPVGGRPASGDFLSAMAANADALAEAYR